MFHGPCRAECLPHKRPGIPSMLTTAARWFSLAPRLLTPPASDMEARIRTWLAEQGVYAPPDDFGGRVQALAPVELLDKLVDAFRGVSLRTKSMLEFDSRIPLSRSFWRQETVDHVEEVLEQFRRGATR